LTALRDDGLLDRERVEWSDHELNIGAERFERRLIEEVSNLRVDVIRELHVIRVELFKRSLLSGLASSRRWSVSFRSCSAAIRSRPSG
jgi:hypothetical protein